MYICILLDLYVYLYRCLHKLIWKEALEDFPSSTNEDRLLVLIGLKSEDSVPQPFLDYCKAALNFRFLKDS
jgi:hypothetical protein